MADPEDPHPRASFSIIPVDRPVVSVPPHPKASSVHVDPQAVSVPPHPPASTSVPQASSVHAVPQSVSVPPHPPASTSVLVDPHQAFSDPVHPPHPQAFIVTVDPPHPPGRVFMLRTRAIKGILLGSIVAILFFLVTAYSIPYMEREFASRDYQYYLDNISLTQKDNISYYRIAMNVVLTIQLVFFVAIARLYIWASSSRTEKIVSCAFLGVLAVFAVDFTLVSYTTMDYFEYVGTMYVVVNIVALSSYCMVCIWKVAISDYCKAYIQNCICKLYLVAQPWLQDLPWNSTTLLVHGFIIVILLFHTICASLLDNRVMQIVAYPAIACLHIWASSSRSEIIVSGAFLGALSLIIVFVSLGTAGVDNGTMFTANIVAISWYCIWKLYLVAKPWLRRWSWAPIEEASWLLLPQQQQQATFRIQDLPRQFSPGEIRAMTQDFRTMVGQGGFAQVFRGLLDGTAVAVKRMATTTAGHAEDDDFLREIAIVANVHHRSLVRLLGYCLQRGGGGGSRYLVYPFLEYGSLDSWLFHGDGSEARRRLLPWPTRRRIAVDVAKALAYLHHECHQQILHLDIKPGNILLDGDLRAHVSDFGISMSITPDLSNVDTRGRGTPGYMAPEMMINAVSAKSDVFSYGMTLLELVGGRRNFEPADCSSSATPDFRRDFFPYIVRERMARGELMEAVDAAMALVDREEVETAVKVALSCIQSQWDMRPSMLAVVDMLEGRVAIDLPPESRRQLTVNFSGLRSSSLTQDR